MTTPPLESVPLPSSKENETICENSGSESESYVEEEEVADLEWDDALGQDTTDDSAEITETPSDKNDTFMARILGPSANKAGLESTDKDMIGRVIYEASKNLLERKKRLEGRDLAHICRQVDADWKQLEMDRDLSQIIVHIDMDAFFAAVEELDNPALKEKPMGVGCNSREIACYPRPIYLASTNSHLMKSFRKFGVRSAMPGYIAKKLCPELIILPPNGAKYKAISKIVHTVLEKYDPQFLAAGIDESYLNITSYIKESKKTAEEVTNQIRKEIQVKTLLTASAGIAANKRLAKICSDMNKPNGQYTLNNDRDAIMSFIKELPIRKLNGIGRVTEQLLSALDVKTGGDMYKQRVVLKLLLSSKSFEFISRAALGLGTTDLSIQYDRKSISVERTFRNLSKIDRQLDMLKTIAEKLSANLERKQIKGQTITLKLKRSDFTVLSRSRSLAQCIFKADDLYLYGKQLLEAEQPIELRLMGVRLSSLQEMQSKQITENITKFLHKSTDATTNAGDLSSPSLALSSTTTMTSTLTKNHCSQFHQSTCPVCNIALEARSKAALHCHVEHCLRKQEQDYDAQPITDNIKK
ncbi:hypothetical protein BDF19DRAFT_411760 [Syncephalis fuscata]|nr:hypothetical protein BDF19DRAFT_411760 [Syncephalis fuscata]